MINFAPKPLSFACRVADLIGGAVDWFERVGARLAEHEDDRRKNLEALVEKWCSRARALEHDVEILHDDAAAVRGRLAKIAAAFGPELKADMAQVISGMPTDDLLSFIEDRIRSGKALASPGVGIGARKCICGENRDEVFDAGDETFLPRYGCKRCDRWDGPRVLREAGT